VVGTGAHTDTARSPQMVIEGGKSRFRRPTWVN
jgi:hypothetical protein